MARAELKAAVSSGEAYASGLGADLLIEVERITRLLCVTPNIGEPQDGGLRRFPLSRFPYALIFRSTGRYLRVLAVAHRRQEPGLWRGRV